MQENQTPTMPTVDSQHLPAQAGTTSPEPVTVTDSQRPKASSFLLVLLSILLFISVIVAGFFAYQTQTLVKELQEIKGIDNLAYPTTTTEPTAMPLATTDPTANWKIYTNAKYGFSFKYPDDWSLATGDVEVPPNNYIVTVTTNKNPSADGFGYLADFSVFLPAVTDQDINSWVLSIKQPEDQIENSLNIGGIKSILLNNCELGCQKNFYLQKNKNIYGIHVFVGDTIKESTQSILDQILSTFKFTN